MLNDSTVCTSVDNIQETAQRILILEAKIEAYKYAIEKTINDSKERDQLLIEKKETENELKKTKRRLFWSKIKTPTLSTLSFIIGLKLGIYISN